MTHHATPRPEALAAETPLHELLRSIPKDAIYRWEDSPMSFSSSPIGLLAHRAADALAALQAPGEAGEEIGAEYDDAAHAVTLAACPPGLFWFNGSLGFKSEYGAMEPVGSNFKTFKVGNRADAYCADSGEYFWGGASTHEDRSKLLVYPVSADAVSMVASHGPTALYTHPPADRGGEWPSAVAEGSILFMRSEGADADRCVCCDGPHIFGSTVVLQGLVDGWGHAVKDPRAFVKNFATKKGPDKKPLYEGRRVRVTVEILPPARPATEGGK